MENLPSMSDIRPTALSLRHPFYKLISFVSPSRGPTVGSCFQKASFHYFDMQGYFLMLVMPDLLFWQQTYYQYNVGTWTRTQIGCQHPRWWLNPCATSSLLKKYIYWKGRLTEREERGETETEIFHSLIHLPSMARARPVRDQKWGTSSGSPTWVQAQGLGHFLLLS